MRRIALIAGGVVGVLVLAVVLVAVFFDFRGFLESRMTAAAGRAVVIRGPIHFHLGRPSSISLSDVRVADVDGNPDHPMATVARASVEADPFALVRGTIHLNEIRLDQPRVNLVRGPKGQGNWEGLGGEKKGTAGPPPAIDRLVIDNGVLSVEDATRRLKAQVDVQTVPAQGGGNGQSRVEVRGRGEILGAPLRLDGSLGAFLSLLDKQNPYPVRVDLAAGRTAIHFDGAVKDPTKFEGLDGDLQMQGDNLQDLYPLAGVSTPHTPPYRLSGRLHHAGGQWQLSNVQGRIGDSDIAGSVGFESGGKRPHLQADLVSRLLNFTDLGVLIGAASKSSQENDVQRQLNQKFAKSDRVLPDAKLDFERVRNMDADVSFTGQKVNAPNLPLDNVRIQLKLHDGMLEFQPLDLGVAGGAISSAIAVDARKDPVNAYLNIWMKGFSLDRIAKGDAAKGNLFGRLQLQVVGNSIRDAFATANGEASFVLENGAARHLLVELVGLDVAKSLAIAAAPGKPDVPISCGVATFDVRNGVMQSRGIIFDTPDSVMTADGTIDLGKEALALDMQGNPKTPSPLAVDSPVRLTGTFKALKVGLSEPQRALAQVGLAAVLGALATPVAAALAFISPGSAPDAPCNQLVQTIRARKSSGGGSPG